MTDIPFKGKVRVPVNFDLQEAYDSARSMGRAFDAFADVLASEADVCTHPEGQCQTYEAGPEELTVCKACDKVISQRQIDGSQDG